MFNTDQIVVTHSANEPAGIALTSTDTGTDGIRAVVVEGECFGRHIEWEEEEEVTVVVSDAAGTPTLAITHSSGFVSRHLGFETANSTWWRYAREVDPASYREHCYRIVRRV